MTTRVSIFKLLLRMGESSNTREGCHRGARRINLKREEFLKEFEKAKLKGSSIFNGDNISGFLAGIGLPNQVKGQLLASALEGELLEKMEAPIMFKDPERIGSRKDAGGEELKKGSEPKFGVGKEVLFNGLGELKLGAREELESESISWEGLNKTILSVKEEVKPESLKEIKPQGIDVEIIGDKHLKGSRGAEMGFNRAEEGVSLKKEEDNNLVKQFPVKLERVIRKARDLEASSDLRREDFLQEKENVSGLKEEVLMRSSKPHDLSSSEVKRPDSALENEGIKGKEFVQERYKDTYPELKANVVNDKFELKEAKGEGVEPLSKGFEWESLKFLDNPQVGLSKDGYEGFSDGGLDGGLTSGEKGSFNLKSEFDGTFTDFLKKFEISVREGKKEAVIELQPPELGKVKFSIEVYDDRVSARFWLSSPEVKGLFESNIQQLQTLFREQGYLFEASFFYKEDGGEGKGNRSELKEALKGSFKLSEEDEESLILIRDSAAMEGLLNILA